MSDVSALPLLHVNLSVHFVFVLVLYQLLNKVFSNVYNIYSVTCIKCFGHS